MGDRVNKLISLTVLLSCAGAVHGGAPSAPVWRDHCLGQAGAGRDAGIARAGAERHLYVSPDGIDANPGSRHAPFKTIQRAAQAATPGTTVHVAPGIYRENVNTAAHGTAAARIRYLSDVKWGARIIGGGTDAVWKNKGNFTDIVDFDLSGTTRLGIVNFASHTLVAGNRVHHLTVSGGCSGGGGAGIANANYRGSHADVIGNVVHDIGVRGQCAHVQGIYSSNRAGKIANNVVFRVSAYGIHLWHAANEVLIANNTVFANGSAGMGGGIVIGAGDKPGTVVLNHTRVINNIVYNNPSASIRQFCYAGQDCIGPDNMVANNLVYGNGKGISLLAGAPTGTIAADPQFVDYRPDGSGNYRLRRGSPGIATGLPDGSPTTDIDHVARPCDAAPDLGAYQRR